MNHKVHLEEARIDSVSRDQIDLANVLFPSRLRECEWGIFECLLSLSVYESAASENFALENFALEIGQKFIEGSSHLWQLCYFLSYGVFSRRYLNYLKARVNSVRMEYLLAHIELEKLQDASGPQAAQVLETFDREQLERNRVHCPWSAQPRPLLRATRRKLQLRLARVLASEHGFYLLIYFAILVALLVFALVSLTREHMSPSEMITGWVEFVKNLF